VSGFGPWVGWSEKASTSVPTVYREIRSLDQLEPGDPLVVGAEHGHTHSDSSRLPFRFGESIQYPAFLV
jgi:hypothetical protein